MREFVHSFNIVCLRPLAVVEPSEWALVKSFSPPFTIILSGTILIICLFTSLGSIRDFILLLYQILSSVLTAQPVEVPHVHGRYKFQRLLLLGLFIVLFQCVIVNDYKTDVTSDLMEPERNIAKFEKTIFPLSTLPYRISSAALKATAYFSFCSKNGFCFENPNALREGLNIPLEKLEKFVVIYTIDNTLLNGNILRPSGILLTINEHGLVPLNLRYTFNFSVAEGSNNRYENTAKFYHRKILPRSRWSPEKHWEALKELLATCFGTETCNYDGGTQRIVIHDSDLSPVFRMEHLRGTMWLTSWLFIISAIILIEEITIKYLVRIYRSFTVS